MALGIERTLEVIESLGEMAVVGVTVAKAVQGGGFISVIRAADKLAAMGMAVQELIKDVPAALPEMRDVDAQEAAKLGAAAYKVVVRVIAAAAKA